MHHFRSLTFLKSDLAKNKKPHKNAVQWHNNLRLINQYFNKMNNPIKIKIKSTIKTIAKSIFIIFYKHPQQLIEAILHIFFMITISYINNHINRIISSFKKCLIYLLRIKYRHWSCVQA